MRASVFLPLLVVVALSIPAASARDAESPEDRLLVAPPRIRVVDTPLRLAASCNSVNYLGGCTAFRGRKLRCSCEATPAGWAIRPSAQLIPFVYLARLADLSHEYKHVDDLRDAAEDYLNELSAEAFDSEDACRAKVGQEELRFERRVDDWIRDSNSRRHPYEGRKLARRDLPRRP